MTDPPVTVILPTHDHAALLPFAIASVTEQSFGDFALVVIGDGVDDATRDVVADVCRRDPRVSFLDRPKALRHAEEVRDEVIGSTDSAVIAYHGDDDLLLPWHLREMLDPSPIFRDIVEREIAPLHAVLAGLVARHCGLARPDAEVHQLAFAMIAMANDYCSSREFIRMLAPAVLSRRNACAAIVDRLVGYCVALLSHEQARRKAQSKGASRGRRVR